MRLCEETVFFYISITYRTQHFPLKRGKKGNLTWVAASGYLFKLCSVMKFITKYNLEKKKVFPFLRVVTEYECQVQR